MKMLLKEFIFGKIAGLKTATNSFTKNKLFQRHFFLSKDFASFLGTAILTLFRKDRGRGKVGQKKFIFPLKLLQTFELAPKIFWLIVLTLFNPFANLEWNFKATLSASPKLLNWTKTTLQKIACSGQILIKLRLW